MRLSQRVVGISNALADLDMVTIQDIPPLSKSAQEVLPVADLILKRLQQALASGAGLWD
jgi:hypothetical protein